MVLLYLALLIAMMFLGGMLIELNPAPIEYRVRLLGFDVGVQSSIIELIGVSALVGAAVMLVPYARALWQGARERRAHRREADGLRATNTDLRREVAGERATAQLMEARAAELQEQNARLEAETQLLLTVRSDEAAAATRSRAPASRWRR